MKHHDLQIRTKKLALQVIEFCEKLPNDETSKILKGQLLHPLKKWAGGVQVQYIGNTNGSEHR